MADNLRKYTTQEVLNKVYEDSSGNTIGINAATAKETLNAALDEANSRLNVSLAGGTISGDVTITGDLTVQGSDTYAYDEIIEGNLQVGNSSTADSNIVIESSSSGDPKLQFTATANRSALIDFVEGSTLQGAIVYKHNGDTLGFSTGSTNRTERFVVNETSSYFTSKLGIGTDSPSSLFHVTSSTADGHIIAESTHAGSNGVVDIRSVADRDSVIHFREGTTVKARIKNDASADALVLTDGADSNTVFIKSNKMGIGTDSPQASLHVESDLRHAWDNNETDLLKVGQAGTDSGFVVWSSGGNGEVYLGNLYNDDAGDINFVTKASVDDNNVKMKIEGGGNVGIGTTSPAVSGGLGLDIEDNTASGGSKGGSLRLGSNDGSAVAQNDRLGVINFCGAEDSSGTMTEGARIDAIADSGWSATENGADLRFFTTDGDASDTEKMRITAEGYVGIGTDSPDTLVELEKVS